MNLKDIERVALALNNSIEATLGDWFPRGVIEGAEFCIGSVSGEAGQSLRIRLKGDKIGIWSDFSEGEVGKDLISLYAYREGLSQGKACAALAAQLGIELTPSDPNFKPNKAVSSIAKRPQKPAPAQAAQGVEDRKPRTEWTPVLPVPGDAGPYPVAHSHRGRPEAHWEYLDQQGQLLGVIYRFKTSDGGKEVLPCVYAQHPVTGACDWRWIQFREPRPLYIRCAFRPELPVLVVEGEKCVDAAFDLVGDVFDVVSWPGGGKAVSKADWAQLSGRCVVLWPDCDSKVYKEKHAKAGQIKPEEEQPGVMAMVELADILRGHGCEVAMVDVPAPGVLDDGWDVADLIADGGQRDDVLAWTCKHRGAAAEPSQCDAVDDSDVPEWLDEMPVIDEVAGQGGQSTPRPAGAGKVSRSNIRASMIATAQGGVKGCRENVYIALKNDPVLLDLVALDQFSLLQVKRKTPPWHSDPGEWNEGDDFHLGMFLANHYGLVLASVGDIEKAVAQIARENAFNPVTDFFDHCAEVWDGQARIERAFVDYWGAEESEYMRLVSLMFFVGLAKRAYYPGVKHDYAPVFEGKQGEGKSTALAILGGEWFADTPFEMGNKDGFLAIQGILIYEIAELEQFNRSEVTAIKAFMSSQKDRYREPYGRRMKNQARRTVFAATTNQDEYFKDTTGNRRFWPVDALRLDLDGLRRDREQLIGEAVHLMRKGVKWYPTPEQQFSLINPRQESREISDVWVGRIWEYLDGRNADGEETALPKLNQVTVRQVLVKALHFDLNKLGNARSESTRVGSIMTKFGWIKRKGTTGAREQYYVRPGSEKEVDQQQGNDDDLPL
ncbi:VapE domain-containing protein [Undibacterium sp. Di26W]|uniref:VapE domain-containing protein n=1 Tax=Undibacterium sp. Di26W TaxID=3413035 RepID=UPI003BF014B3